MLKELDDLNFILYPTQPEKFSPYPYVVVLVVKKLDPIGFEHIPVLAFGF